MQWNSPFPAVKAFSMNWVNNLLIQEVHDSNYHCPFGVLFGQSHCHLEKLTEIVVQVRLWDLVTKSTILCLTK